jgi:hypothetical protein
MEREGNPICHDWLTAVADAVVATQRNAMAADRDAGAMPLASQDEVDPGDISVVDDGLFCYA